MEFVYSRPLKGSLREKTEALLAELGLRWDETCEMTLGLMEDDTLIATGSRTGNILKCIGVSPGRQGEGLIAGVVTELIKDAYSEGHSRLFLFTKPDNARLFRELGFYPIASTEEAALLENARGGIDGFIRGLEQPDPSAVNGAVVANCNPFTNGHLYLVEEAAKQCDILHLFILSEDRSQFPADDRMRLVKAATGHLPNVVVHPTGPYLISSATFPDYFIKDRERVREISCRLDIAIFAERFAKAMHIQRRFVGTEPYCAVTSAYNRQMSVTLPSYGIEIVEIPRLEALGKPVSASRVRELLERGELASIRELVPPTTYSYLEGRCQP